MTTFFLMMLYSASLLGGNWFAYVSSLDDQTIVPLNLTTNTFGTAIPLTGFVLFNPVITPDGRTIYASCPNSADVIVIDVASNSVIATVPVPFPGGIAMSPDGSSVYVVSTGSGVNRVSKIDVATNTVVDRISTALAADGANDIAITPDGLLAYVVSTLTANLTVIDLTTDTVTIPSIPVGVEPVQIAMTPDGKTAYVADSLDGLFPVDLATNTVGPVIALSGGGADTLAVTPDGSLVYGVTESILICAVSTATNSEVANINVGLSSEGIAIRPDGLVAYLAKGFSGIVDLIDIPTQTLSSFVSTGVDTPMLAIVITPDQAPVAAFSFTSPNTFDASQSSASVGGIASYAWDFGDGTTLVTTSPIVTHNYAMEGTFLVTLTVTDTAGTSTVRVFTGHVVTNNGGPSATFSLLITIPNVGPTPTPPSHFVGRVVENKFATQTEYIHQLKWIPSSDPSVVEYQLFRNGKLIAVIPASGPFVYLDHNRRKHRQDVYTLIAVSSSGLQSLPVTNVVPLNPL